MNKTCIELLRKDSSGISGTIENAKHHAKSMLPFINGLRVAVGKLGFATWRQGNNIHEFVTVDGRRFTLRGIIKDKSDSDQPNYIGVRLSIRISRSEEHRLLDIVDVSDISTLLEMMKNLAKPQQGQDGRLMASPRG